MIKHLAPIALCAVFSATTATTANAEDILTWGDTNGWAILIDTSNGHGCLMEKHFDDSTMVQFGAVPDREGGFFAAYNPAWSNIEDAATGTVKFEFPDKRFAGQVAGVARGGLFGGYAFFDNPNMPMEFARNEMMTIIGPMGRVVKIDLTGTLQAIKSVQACQAEQPKPD